MQIIGGVLVGILLEIRQQVQVWRASPHFSPHQTFMVQFDEHQAVRNAYEKTQRFTGEDSSHAQSVFRSYSLSPHKLLSSLWLSDSWYVRVQNLD